MSVITIGIDPTIEIGPITIAWHGLMIAVGILVGGGAVAYDARRRGLNPERIYAIGLILVVGALVGGRAFYLLEHDRLDDPGGRA
jgi:phosphatidylglycerol:prolipoprotein diacylglycerol transferase